MKHLAAFSLLSALSYPAASLATELTFGGTVAITSNYLSDGLSETGNRPALQFQAEVGANGFYANIFASQVKDDAGNAASLDLSAGYRAELATAAGYDIGITQSFRNVTRNDGAEIYGSLYYPVSDRLTLTAEASYDLAEKTFGGNLGADFAATDTWALTAVAGQTDPQASPFWGLGVSHDLSATTSVALDYQDTSSTEAVYALTLNYTFGRGGE